LFQAFLSLASKLLVFVLGDGTPAVIHFGKAAKEALALSSASFMVFWMRKDHRPILVFFAYKPFRVLRSEAIDFFRWPLKTWLFLGKKLSPPADAMINSRRF
jgi:hypothetical protein